MGFIACFELHFLNNSFDTENRPLLDEDKIDSLDSWYPEVLRFKLWERQTSSFTCKLMQLATSHPVSKSSLIFEFNINPVLPSKQTEICGM